MSIFWKYEFLKMEWKLMFGNVVLVLWFEHWKLGLATIEQIQTSQEYRRGHMLMTFEKICLLNP